MAGVFYGQGMGVEADTDVAVGDIVDKSIIDEVVQEDLDEGNIDAQGNVRLDGGLDVEGAAVIIVLVVGD